MRARNLASITFATLPLLISQYTCSTHALDSFAPQGLAISTSVRQAVTIHQHDFLSSLARSVNRFYFLFANLEGGRTFDQCDQRAICKGNRRCVPVGGSRSICTVFDFCLCLPPKFKTCDAQSQCPKKDVCAHTAVGLRPLCVSKLAEKNFGFLQKIEDTVIIPSQGRTLDACYNSKTCSFGRNCLFPGGSGFRECRGREGCFCVPKSVVSCFTSTDCENGEVCTNAPISSAPVCSSKDASDRLVSVSNIPDVPPKGFTLDSCMQNEDCEGNRRCTLFLNNSPRGSCKGSFPCACFPSVLPKCVATSDCTSRSEMCAETVFTERATCVSYEAVEFNGVDRVIAQEVCPVVIKKDFPNKNFVKPSARFAARSEGLIDEARDKGAREPLKSSTRIIGGQFVSPNLRPYMAAVFDKNRETICSGTLISPRWVLTAAHCKPKKGSLVALGLARASAEENVVIRASRAFSHPMFNLSTLRFDIAVVELEYGPHELSLFMKVNEDPSIPKVGSYARSLGYGLSSFRGRLKDKKQYALRQVDTPIARMDTCAAAYKTLDPPFKIFAKDHICSGERRGGCGVCNGDSGGPLLQYVNGVPTVVGIASFGVGCASPKFESGFSRVASYASWLKSTPAKFYTDQNVYGEDITACRPGEYVFSVSSKVKFCRPCPPNEISKGGMGAVCEKCPKGLRRDDKNGARCSCQGIFAVGRGLDKDGTCARCRPGTFSRENNRFCRPCPKGKFAQKAGSTRCVRCKKGTSAPKEGSVRCTKLKT